ncbi:hypothetical protein AWB79_01576 [Caballeronia hypogeia]|uniref:Uncharacterized protein n=2 Tax=Caballeronia hypogeia TaxID=1777140 RepID=A0A157ZZP6_9BURK|nr:hypothetical protein AWB79_01576 [Caballeronia hypogeia]
MNANEAHATQEDRIRKEHCHVSFITPALTQYVELPDNIYFGGIVCYLPFLFTGALKQKRVELPGTVEDWRRFTDFVVTIERGPLTEAVAKVEAPDGGAQSGLFELTSKSRTELTGGGDLYTLNFKAIRRTENMRLLIVHALTIYVFGNGTYSATFYDYSSGKTRTEIRKQRIYQELFSSFNFLPERLDKTTHH